MENSTYISMSRQAVLQTQMELVANNIANIDTPGFRAQALVFKEVVGQPRGQQFPYSMVDNYGQYESTAPGPVTNTAAPLDLALQGPGFFGVVTPAGVRYTRAGNFTLNAAGAIVNANGQPVSSLGGTAVVVPPGTKEIKIDEHGTVSTENGAIGQLQVVEFGNSEALTLEGGGLYRAEGNAQPGPASNTRVIQGALEGANVQGVLEVTKMIRILRDYQSIQRIIQNEHDLQRSMIQRLTQAS